MCRSIACLNAWEYIIWLICVAVPTMGLMIACAIMFDVMANHYLGVSFLSAPNSSPERSTIVE